MAKIFADLELMALNWIFPVDIVTASKELLLLQVDVWRKAYDGKSKT